MTDDRLRSLERQAAAGDLEAEGALLNEQVRLGSLPAARLEHLAEAAYPPACLALGRPLPTLPSQQEDDELLRFREALATAIVWAREQGSLGDPLTCLRSAELQVSFTFRDSVPDRLARIESIRAGRERLLSEGGWVPGARAYGLGGGRLLLFDVDGSLADGAAELATQGLFDAENLPPWDTFLAFVFDGLPPGSWRGFRSYLVSYVPPLLLPLVEEGIEVNPECCLVWADDHDGPFTRRLRSAGLI